MISPAALITRLIDLFYVRPVSAIVLRQTFRYAACGGITLAMNTLWYSIFYNFVFCRVNLDLELIVISPHIAALILVFPITFFTGFWLNSRVAFHSSPVMTRTQLWRYTLTVAGSILLTYGCMKFFVEMCGVWPTPSMILTNIITVVYSFLTAKYFTFKSALE